MSIAYGGIIAFFFRSLNLLTALLLMVVTSNQLGVEGRGTFAIGIILVGIIANATGGMTASAAYQVSNQRKDVGTVLLNGGALASGLALLCIGGGLAGWRLLEGQAAEIALPVGASAAAVILTSLLSGTFLGSERFLRYNLSLFGPPALSLLAISFTVFVLDERSAQAALTAHATGQCVAFVLLLASASPALVGAGLDPALSRAMATFGVVVGVTGVISFLNYRADTFVVEYFEGRAGVGLYSNAVLIAEALWQVSAALVVATYARVASLDREAAIALTTRVMRHTVVLLGAVGLGLFLMADVVFLVLRPEYAEGATALRILIPGTVVFGLMNAFSGYYTYQRGMPFASAVVAGIGLVANLVLSMLLVPVFGVNGAALGSSLGYVAAVACGLAYFMRDAGVGPRSVFQFGQADVDDYRTLISRVRGIVRPQ